MAPGTSQTYAVSMTKQVCVEEGPVSDHYMSALNRGKGPDVKEYEDDPYNEGILVHYTETCESKNRKRVSILWLAFSFA